MNSPARWGRPGHLALLVTVVVFAVYLGTLADGVTWANYGGDSGELIAVSYSLGIAHPTGYPLYTLLGRVFTFIPLGSVGFRVTLMSALAAASACGILLLVLHHMTRSYLASLLGAMALGLSKTLWGQASIAEVYALHLFFMVLLLAALFLENKDKSGYTGVPFGRRLCLIALLLGFGFANHMMTVLIVPAVAVWFGSRFLESGNGKSERMEALQTRLLVRTLLMAVFFFSLGIMLYLYLPLRSSIRPAVELGPVRTLANLWGHVTGKQFQGWMFSRSTPEVTYYLREYRVIDQFSLLGGLLGTIGAWEMAKCSPFYFFPLLCFFLADLVYAVNYNIPDIAPYFIPSYLVFAIWMAWGLRLLLTYRWPDWESSRWRKTGSALSAVVAVLFSVWLPYYSYCRFVTLVREARQPAARMYARKVFDRVPERSVVLSIGTGETFSLWHRQACVPWAAEKEIKVVLRTYLAFPWYIDKLSEENPDLDFSPVHTLAHSYLGHWNDIDFLEYRRRLNDLTLALIRTNFSRCTLYLTNKKLFDSEEYFLAQAGPVFRVLKK